MNDLIERHRYIEPQWSPARRSLTFEEYDFGLFRIVGIDCDETQLESIRILEQFREAKSELGRKQCEALRLSFCFREAKYTKSAAMQKHVY